MLLTLRDVAKLFNVPQGTVLQWIKQKALPAHRAHHQYRFNRSELLEWATLQNVPLSADVFNGRNAATTISSFLQEALGRGGVFREVAGSDKASVLSEVVKLMKLPHETDRDYLLKILLAREAIQSTAVGDGIAMPHARNPIVLRMSHPMVTLCFLEKPIDFGALDGLPVFCLFTLVSPTVRSHLTLLSRLAYMLRREEFKMVLFQRGTEEQIMNIIRQIESQFSQTADARVMEEQK